MTAVTSMRGLIGDRISVALLIALALHAAVLLGLTFQLEMSPLSRAAESLDVVLVNFSTEEPPEEAEFLAPVSQRGGGEAAEVARPAAELAPSIPSLSEGDMPVASESVMPTPAQEQRELVVARTDSQDVRERTEVEQPDTVVPTAAELMQQRMHLAQLQAQQDTSSNWRSQLPRRKFISANTKEYEFASYMAAWVAKVERVGNLNYPLELKSRGVAGDLLMTVGIARDGSVESITIKRASGTPELDLAAQRIVRLAAPYAPLPDDIAAEVDVLHITRTWRFASGNRFE
ncbi:MAG: TonB family protein [Xanthomonadales bacterium]|nr:TonB family protein [Xanthomonadales bacterium]